MFLILCQIYFIPELFKCESFVLFILIHKTVAFKEDLVLNIFLKCENIVARWIRYPVAMWFFGCFLFLFFFNGNQSFENFTIYILYRACQLLTNRFLLLY